MDPPDPRALCDLCLAQVCCHLDVLCDRRADGSLRLTQAPMLPQEMADQLLQKMATEGLLNDRTIGIFRNCKELRLRRAVIRHSPLAAESFRLALCPHRLQELDASWVSGGLTGANILSGLASNPECRSSLQRLSLNGLHLDWGSLSGDGNDGGGACVGFSSLRGLRTLSLAQTDLTDVALEDACSLPQLESLDISCTSVTDLTALLERGGTLKALIAHSLWQLDMSPARLLFILSQLHTLRHLDFSDDHLATASAGGGDGGREGDDMVRQLLEGSPQVLPALVSLDVSGRKGIAEAEVKAFVEARSGLVFLGLLATGASSCDVLLSSRSTLKVTGGANESQLCEALKRYRERECFVREALVQLYTLTTDMEKPRPDLLKLVLDGMQSHSTSVHVQLVSTACVFNLTTHGMSESMSVGLVSRTVAQLLCAMKNFPNHKQVQKNCLLALCSDYILQEVPFDKFLAVKLVMNWLSSHEDPTLQRMAVAVISILVSKLSTAETAQLGSDIFIMKQLMGIVQQKAMGRVVDTTLKFALSALWNLTDETPAAARHFIQCQGLELYEEVLETYYSEAAIQQKVLGLLHTSIMTWTPPEREMVSYRSFRPFLPLLQTSQSAGVQLWAVWAIHLVSSQNTSHYSTMLEKEGVLEFLKALAAHGDTHSDIKGLADTVLCLVGKDDASAAEPCC